MSYSITEKTSGFSLLASNSICATDYSGRVLHASCILKAAQRVNTGIAPLAKQPVGKSGPRDGTHWRLKLELKPMSS